MVQIYGAYYVFSNFQRIQSVTPKIINKQNIFLLISQKRDLAEKYRSRLAGRSTFFQNPQAQLRLSADFEIPPGFHTFGSGSTQNRYHETLRQPHFLLPFLLFRHMSPFKRTSGNLGGLPSPKNRGKRPFPSRKEPESDTPTCGFSPYLSSKHKTRNIRPLCPDCDFVPSREIRHAPDPRNPAKTSHATGKGRF